MSAVSRTSAVARWEMCASTCPAAFRANASPASEQRPPPVLVRLPSGLWNRWSNQMARSDLALWVSSCFQLAGRKVLLKLAALVLVCVFYSLTHLPPLFLIQGVIFFSVLCKSSFLTMPLLSSSVIVHRFLILGPVCPGYTVCQGMMRWTCSTFAACFLNCQNCGWQPHHQWGKEEFLV